jgi:hypothetical protein
MTRFAWLQSRTQFYTVAVVLVALAVLAAITGAQLAHLYTSLVAHCQSGCDFTTNQFLSHDQFLDRAFDILTMVTPALFGIFWGAPLLAREWETGTYRLAWTQSVTRSRWLITKLLLAGGATVVAAAALTLTITWWYTTFHGLDSNQYDVFDRRDIVPVAYAAFAFAFGALMGGVIRRTVPAMAATLGGFVFARVAAAVWIRPHLVSRVHQVLSLAHAGPDQRVRFGIESHNGSALRLVADGSGPKNSWTLSSHLVTGSGHVPSSAELATFLHQTCPTLGLPPSGPQAGPPIVKGAPPGAQACFDQAAKTFHLVVTYVPARSYWALQWLETGVFLALAVLAGVGCYWWVTKRN